MWRVLINGVDQTGAVAFGSISVTLGTTKEATTAQFSVVRYGGKFVPAGEQEVELWWDTDAGNVKLFGGYITKPTRRSANDGTVTYVCSCKNKVHRLDRKLVNVGYEDQTAAEIIDHIVANFSGPGITTGGVDPDAGLAVTSISYNNVRPSEAIQQLADTLGCEWYVDADGEIQFFSKLTESAPFGLDDDGGKYVFDSLQLSEDFTQIRNSVLVEGDEELSTATEHDNFVGNGEQHTYVLSRKYTGLTVTLNGAPLTVGIQNIDTFATKDCLYDFNLRTLYFDPAAPPAIADDIEASGKYYLDLVVRYRSVASVAAYGERQHYIQDKTLKSRADARSRALAEISAYGRQVLEGSFVTYEQGLAPGQKIRIQSDFDAFDNEYVIQRMTGTTLTVNRMQWKVELVSVKTYELIDLLADIIRGRREATAADTNIPAADVVYRDIEVARVVSVRSAVTVSRGLKVGRQNRRYLNSPPIWVAAEYVPSSIDDRKRPLFVDRGCLVS